MLPEPNTTYARKPKPPKTTQVVPAPESRSAITDFGVGATGGALLLVPLPKVDIETQYATPTNRTSNAM